MKKVAFILAIALIFLVGITTVLKHKLSAQTQPKPNNIVLWIPIDKNGDVVFDKVNSDCNTSGSGSVPDYPDPRGYKKIHFTKTITVTKAEKNPTYCYWVYQGGALVERCISY